jgi:pre-rRNA-processing protein TSR4
VFLSPDGSKLHKPGAVKAFRCQLPRVNEFYASEANMDADPPEVEYTDPELAPYDPWSQKVPPATFKELEIIVEEEEVVSS